jgi:hypothetical protein
MSMFPPPLCKDCQSFILNTEEFSDPRNQIEFGQCRKAGLRSVITGKHTYRSCTIERTNGGGLCGPDGRNFERKT